MYKSDLIEMSISSIKNRKTENIYLNIKLFLITRMIIHTFLIQFISKNFKEIMFEKT